MIQLHDKMGESKIETAAARCVRLAVCIVVCALLLLPAVTRAQATEEDEPAYSERLLGPSTAYLRDPEFSEEKIAAVFERFAKMMEQAHLLPPELLEVASVAAADAAMEEVVAPNSSAAAPPERGASSGASSSADADVRKATRSFAAADDVVLNRLVSSTAQASPASASGAAGLDSSQLEDPVLLEEAPPAPPPQPESAASTQAADTGRRLQSVAHSTKGTAASRLKRKQQVSGPSKQATREQASQADAGAAGEAADADELAGFKISSDSKDSKGRRTITIDIPITDEALQELAESMDADEDPQLSSGAEDLMPGSEERADATPRSGRSGMPFVRDVEAAATSKDDAHQPGGVGNGDDPIDAALQRLLAMADDHESDEVLEDDDSAAGARPLLEPSKASGQAADSSEPDDDVEQQDTQRRSAGRAQAGADRDSSDQQDDASDDPLVWLKQMAGLVSPEAAAAANNSAAHAILGRIIHLGRHAGSIHRSYSHQAPDASSSSSSSSTAGGADAPAGNCDAAESGGGCSDSDSETSMGPEATTRRRLQQALGGNTGGGPASLFSSAFKLIFGNALDLFIGGRFPALILGDLRNTIANYNWIRDLADFVDAPLENFVNANYLPLPQDNDQFYNLVRRFLLDYCAVEAAESSSQVLAEFRGPRYRIRINPLTCPITKDQDTGRRVLNLRRCTPAQLVITTEPYIIRGPHRGTVAYLGAECRFNAYAGSDVFYTLGAGVSSYTLRRSTRGVDLVPVVNQYNLAQSFFPVFFRTPNRRPPPPAPPGPPAPPPPAASAAG